MSLDSLWAEFEQPQKKVADVDWGLVEKSPQPELKKDQAWKEEVREIPTAEWQAKNISQGLQAAHGLRESAKKGLIKGGTELTAFGLDLLGYAAKGAEITGRAINRSIEDVIDPRIEITPYTGRRLRKEGKELPERYQIDPEWSNIMSTGIEKTSEIVRNYGDKLTKLSVGDFESETLPEKYIEKVANTAYRVLLSHKDLSMSANST